MLYSFASSSPVLAGALASLCAGLATAIGALPILVIRKLSEQAQDVMLGFAAGVMLAASFFSLIIPGIDVAQEQGATKLGAVTLVIAGILFGALKAGSYTMQAAEGIPVDIVLVVQSFIVLFIAAPPLVRSIFRLPTPDPLFRWRTPKLDRVTEVSK